MLTAKLRLHFLITRSKEIWEWEGVQSFRKQKIAMDKFIDKYLHIDYKINHENQLYTRSAVKYFLSIRVNTKCFYVILWLSLSVTHGLI